MQDVVDRARTVVYVVQVSNLEGETVTRGSPYKVIMMNKLEISHLGKLRINPTR